MLYDPSLDPQYSVLLPRTVDYDGIYWTDSNQGPYSSLWWKTGGVGGVEDRDAGTDGFYSAADPSTVPQSDLQTYDDPCQLSYPDYLGYDTPYQ